MIQTQAAPRIGPRTSTGLPLRRVAKLLVKAILGITLLLSGLVFAVGALPALAGMKTMVEIGRASCRERV